MEDSSIENRAKACIRVIVVANVFCSMTSLGIQPAPGLLRQWRQFTHEQSDPPGMKHFLAFIKRNFRGRQVCSKNKAY